MGSPQGRTTPGEGNVNCLRHLPLGRRASRSRKEKGEGDQSDQTASQELRGAGASASHTVSSSLLKRLRVRLKSGRSDNGPDGGPIIPKALPLSMGRERVQDSSQPGNLPAEGRGTS